VFTRATWFEVLLLEYHDERSGGFGPLRDIPDEKVVVLGLISSKRPELEDPAELLARIDEAARYRPRNLLCLSPQCGFASALDGNPLTLPGQDRKLRLMSDTAARPGRPEQDVEPLQSSLVIVISGVEARRRAA
jgi:5-methyltetrahydropteroyltriglutamate--homocysteine methyltransferase